MIRYKLTDTDGRTHGGLQWGEGTTHTAPGEGELCTAGWIHVYDDPLLAVLHNEIHGNFANARLYLCECTGKEKREGQLKAGFASVTTIRQIPLPAITTEQRVRYGILCALAVLPTSGAWAATWRAWAEKWLEGGERTKAAAEAAEAAAEDAWAAIGVAEAAAWAATWAATRAAAEDAWAAAGAAEAAAWAAEDAWAAGSELDLLALAQRAVAVEVE